MVNWMEDVREILARDAFRELADDLSPYFKLVTSPNDDAEAALEIAFKVFLDQASTPLRAMWLAFVTGAAWQKGIDEEGADRD